MKEILVIGGAGFIGSHLQKSLKSKGLRVTIIDSLIERVHGKSPVQPNENFFRLDSRDALGIKEILDGKKFSEIYFLASDTSTGSSLEEIDQHVSQNTTALAGLLKALSINSFFPDRIVLTSSRAVYGEGHEIDSQGNVTPLRSRTIHELDSQMWLANRHQEKEFFPNYFVSHAIPSNIYGLTKKFQEDLLEIWCKSNEVKCDIYRLQNVIGPGQAPKNSYSGIITTFCTQAIAGQRLKIFEGGEIIRDFVHVSDVVEALQIPLRQNYDRVDIGNGSPMKLQSLAEMISSICGLETPEITNFFRHGDVSTAYAHPSSLRALSRTWRPRRIGEDVLAEILEYVRSDLAKL
jgi:dTDP-L-rhamnose 4-epimerase